MRLVVAPHRLHGVLRTAWGERVVRGCERVVRGCHPLTQRFDNATIFASREGERVNFNIRQEGRYSGYRDKGIGEGIGDKGSNFTLSASQNAKNLYPIMGLGERVLPSHCLLATLSPSRVAHATRCNRLSRDDAISAAPSPPAHALTPRYTCGITRARQHVEVRR